VRQKLTNAYYKPVKQADDYFSHNANKTAADKPPMREEALNEVKVGDHVHLGFGKRGGAGHRGVVTKVAGTMVHIKQHDHDAVTNKYGPREFAGPITHVTVEKSVNENAPSMSVGNGAIVGVAPPDATVDFAAQKIKRVKKLGMVKRPKPKAE
jgi:ribosomal protein L15